MTMRRPIPPFRPPAMGPRWLLNSLLWSIAVLLVLQFVISQRLIYPFDAPDERVHFARAHDVAFAPGLVKLSSSAGKVSVGAFFYDPQPIHDCYGKPDCLLSSTTSELTRLRLHQFFQADSFLGAAGSDNSFPYAGGNYLHLIPSLRLAGLLRLTVLQAYQIARASSGLLFLGVSALLLVSIWRQRLNASRAFPIALLGLGFWLPSSIFLANSVSGDFLVTVASVLIALFLITAPWGSTPRLFRLGLLLQPLLYCMVLGKLPYAPIVIAAVVLTWLRCPQARKGWFVGATLLSFAWPLWWYVHSREAVLQLFQSQRGDWVGARLSSAELLEWVLGSMGTLVSQAGDLYRQMVGVFGNGPVARLFLPEAFSLIHAVLVLVILGSVVVGSIQASPSWRHRLLAFLPPRDAVVCLLGVILSYFMICYGLRIYWTTSYPLDGLQGRYFLPLLPWLAVAFEACFVSHPHALNVASPMPSATLLPASMGFVNHTFSRALCAVLVVSMCQLIFYLKNIFHHYPTSSL